jgi:hypothetical protein
MTESAYSSIRGAEISERSTELVLPSSAAEVAAEEAAIVDDASARESARSWRTTALAESTELEPASAGAIGFDSPVSASPAEEATSLANPLAPPETESATLDRGRALPGERGPRNPEAVGSQRPSFWRRIALGRRNQALRAAQESGPVHEIESSATGSRNTPTTANPRGLVARDANELAARANEAVERRIVEPLLQALVSVEAKLERSHVDLVGRSEQVEQRLTQLWDIEEQLGAIGELQDSVLQVTEQQRRLESALVAQSRLLRWLVVGIILSFAVAAFSVAFFLHLAR